LRDGNPFNLLRAEADSPLFPGIHGYDDTIVAAAGSTRCWPAGFHPARDCADSQEPILRALDRFSTLAAGVGAAEVNDDPFAPISKYARERLEAEGDATPVMPGSTGGSLCREARLPPM
jgi:magnesium chelatase subunit I